MKKRRTRTIAAVAITAILIYGAASLLSATVRLHRAEEANRKLLTEIASAEEENRTLLELIEESDSDAAKERLANERLGLVKPGEIKFTD